MLLNVLSLRYELESLVNTRHVWSLSSFLSPAVLHQLDQLVVDILVRQLGAEWRRLSVFHSTNNICSTSAHTRCAYD
jgi:hypothetical protein